jgi:ComF family protein
MLKTTTTPYSLRTLVDCGARWLHHSLALLAPPECAACGSPLLSAALFCARCGSAPQAPPIAPPAGIDRLWLGGLYTPPLSDAILRFKFAGRSDLARPLAHWLAHQASAPLLSGDPIWVPVPSHASRLACRGFNPAALLAQRLRRELGGRVIHALRRCRGGAPQRGLGAAARRRNLDGAFAATRSLQGLSIALVDDVLTTGTTLATCATALRAAGAVSVEAWVLAAAA